MAASSKTTQEPEPYYNLAPHKGSFEVSLDGILVWSKRQRKRWPDSEDVATRCMLIVDNELEGQDHSLFHFQHFEEYKAMLKTSRKTDT